MIDVVIIGKGPAGITAAIYAKRAGLKVVVIGKDGGALEKTEEIDNYYGFEQTISGKDLIQKGIEQAKRLGIEVITDEVVGIEYIGIFKITAKQNTYETKALVIATGANRVLPNIKGLKEYEGKGISYCALCDGFFYKGKDVAVLGNKDYALHEASELLRVVNSVTILTNGREIPEYRSDKLIINQKEIKEIAGEEVVNKVEFADGTSVGLSGIFVAEGTASSVDFARKLGAEVIQNKLVVNENMETNIPGLYAAGDCTGGLMQISKSVYEGTKAGTEVAKHIKGKA